MGYNPTFYRDAKGNFNSASGFISIKNGTDAFISEDEINETQWIQNEARAEMFRKITKSGCLEVGKIGDTTNGSIINLNETHLNGCSIMPFDVVFNGYLSRIEYFKKNLNQNYIDITFQTPPVGNFRIDSCYIEFWFKELEKTDEIPKFGGVINDSIDYDIIDKRIQEETSHRVQLQWIIRTVADIPTNSVNALIDKDGNINKNIYPYGGRNILTTNYNFEKSQNDDNLFIAGSGTEDDKALFKTIDGFSYAIPLFSIKRLNNSGYDITYNPDGGIDYVDATTVSDRPDGKFSNILYSDQIIDNRYLSAVGKEQYNTVYLKLDEWDQYKKDLDNSTSESKPDTIIKRDTNGDYSANKGNLSTGVEIGDTTKNNSPYIDFHSSGNNNDFDGRIVSTGGNSTDGNGIINIIANDATVNNNHIYTTIDASIKDEANKLVLRDTNGSIKANDITSTGSVIDGGFEFILGNADQASRGNSGASRALVKGMGSTLVVNYNNDFTGGTIINSNLEVKGDLKLTGGKIYGSLAGPADSASKLSAARNIILAGNATGSVSFDGTTDVTINTTVNDSSHVGGYAPHTMYAVYAP